MPFGEYVPLGWLIGFVRSWAEFISDFDVGKTATVFPLPGAPFGTVICYEVIFPELFREFVVRGASFMVNITNDAWFGQTSGPWQHLGDPVVARRRAPGGDRAGGEHRRLGVRRAFRTREWHAPPVRAGAAARSVWCFGRARTLYTRLGDWLAYGCLGLGAGVLGFAIFRRSACGMLGELKRDVAELEKRLDDLRGHL